ncbi:LacI family transcriptional regulator [Microbacterium sp. EYE_5]|uniref:LacI family DNA-binding transcriptional regulator n=1 Tax=unclassified Microbacterium TaxID=2609290 RepID=UPI002005EB9A|nr:MULTISPECIES: LacI family DNA-binding transcriptional regulator [unclassified Microbacterium]MCK6079780.1 LacI family transcriptional regulator [Microbacterium sp. EYE_382]MCK6085051.1 LacI family transcriptional regulator [Microbacterium sp. EYE_384]MCK6122723.1 LacI family transcriptional regulator [Microbacterium sp. EYE_80]MCK6125814.1 LacI family transcriptional regulator [Microbacterium sp. EYE_79]MCK6140735.1 LacI family transcriptional regulator [Microbacterium sp. EYE_39]
MPPETRPTIADVARAAGVSKGLVSFALNGRPGVAADTRQRIMAVAADLGWTPSLSARSLSVGRAFACGLVIGRSPDVIAADPFFPSFIAGLEDEFSVTGQALVLAVATPGRQEEATYRSLATGRRVDGVILTDIRAGDPRIALLAELQIPAVTLGVPDVESPFGSVSTDDGAGIRLAVEHLVALGHRRVAHVAGPAEMLHAQRRRRAFSETADAAGLDSRVIETDFSAADGARATASLLDAAAPPTAIVYSNDNMAVAGMGVAHQRGLRVPDDLSITGFDDTEIGRWIHPALTSVATDARGWGVTAARALLGAIAGDAPTHLDLADPTLAVRGSTAPPADG